MPMIYDLNPRECWRTICRRKAIVICTIVTVILLSLVFSILVRPTPIYKTYASVKVEKSGILTGRRTQSIAAFSTNYMETQTVMIKSHLIMEPAAKKMGSIPRETSSNDVRDNPKYLSAVLALTDKVEAKQEGNSDIINITAFSDDPRYAQRLANTVAQAYRESHAAERIRRMTEAAKFIESHVIVAREKLRKSEEAMINFREANRTISMGSQSSGLVRQFSDVQEKHHHDLAVLGKINQDDQIKSLPAKALELVRLEREAGVNRDIYTMLEKQYQEFLIQNAEPFEEVQIIKPALAPSRPINPPKTAATTGLGLIIGIVLAVVLAFVIDTFDTSVGAAEKVEDFLGIRVLGVIPHVDFDELKAPIEDKLAKEVDRDRLWRIGRMVSHFAPKTASAESYRVLRTNIDFVKLEKETKTIVFTSSSAQEGKTTVSINLAVAMAQAGHKVLLIDGDFRRPVISKIFGIPSFPGLTDVILGNYGWRDVVRSITDLMTGKMMIDELMATPGLDNLYIMTCGTIAPNPSELVSTKMNTDVISDAHEEYDFVIIDAPPVLAATDAAVWGAKADGVVIVYRVGKIARSALKRAKAQLDNVRARIIGVVLNGVNAEISPDDEYHGNYYYHYTSEGKTPLTLKEKILSWPRSVKRNKKDISGKPGDVTKDTLKPLMDHKPIVKSGVFRIGLLILALGLLIAGLYYSRVMNRPLQVPAKLGNIIMKPFSPKVQTAPVTAGPSRTSVNPSTAASFPLQGATVTLEEKGADTHGIALPATPQVPNHPYTIQVRATQSLGTAKDTVAALKSHGHDAYSEKVDLKEKGVWHRIFIGRFASKNDARQYIQGKEIAAVYPDFMIHQVVRMIGGDSENKNDSPEKKSVPR